MLQFQLIIQILMTDYLQQEVDISEDVGKGSIASSGPITIPFTTKSYSRTLHGAVFLCNVHTNNAASDMRTHLDSIVCGSHKCQCRQREIADAQEPC